MRKVKVKHRKSRVDCRFTINWNAAPPFAMSEAGKLVHRVRFAASHLKYDTSARSHDSVGYWCGNCTTSPLWFEEPPDGKLVCVHCETKAVAWGEKPSDELCGRHVHKGIQFVRKTCCDDPN